MVEKLPRNLSGLTQDTLRHAVKARDERLTPLFRRWPSLSPRELEELQRLYQERVRVAKYLGRTQPVRKGTGPKNG